MALDITSFRNAISQLDKAIGYSRSSIAQGDPGLQEQLRNSVIQCFEFTYELSHKMLKRYLAQTSASADEVDAATFQHLIRTGSEKGLLRSDWRMWRLYREARNDSSHTYDKDKAEAVAAVAPDFLEEAKFLADKISNQSPA